ncbi:hypothetical protein [Halorhabdus sp. BNX81]|uniref:hypothetical protein n=1 Tax=Halorhabdus sp. BNX81 TaxID=2980181 RepID=UPI0023DD420B|nr:hypothetical protein [Halorhabdus sp. BNX81]WEL22169.1 Uncharacterized protein HBNXHr_2119 [Halorhabdus sp. BNX81]
MDRRKFLAGAGLSLSATVSGCIGPDGPPVRTTKDDSEISGGTESDDGPDTPVLTGFDVSEQSVTVDLNDWRYEPGGVFLGSRDAALKYFGDTTAKTYVEDTDFENGERLVYVRAVARQTCYELRLNNDPQMTDGAVSFSVGINRTSPTDEPCGDAMTAIATLLRLSFDPGGPPADVVSVSVAGESEALRLEVET